MRGGAASSGFLLAGYPSSGRRQGGARTGPTRRGPRHRAPSRGGPLLDLRRRDLLAAGWRDNRGRAPPSARAGEPFCGGRCRGAEAGFRRRRQAPCDISSPSVGVPPPTPSIPFSLPLPAHGARGTAKGVRAGWAPRQAPRLRWRSLWITFFYSDRCGWS
jgi:hypothetical protein